ncbi:hypothetical protein E4U48_006216 [Claviceps purpurea]|nr:hypothetical protein E4U48_006216 [Claviceps purpurea]
MDFICSKQTKSSWRSRLANLLSRAGHNWLCTTFSHPVPSSNRFGRAPHLPIVDDLIARSSHLASGFDHDGLGTRSFCDAGGSILASDRAYAVSPVQKPQNKLTSPHVAAIHVPQDEPTKIRPY